MLLSVTVFGQSAGGASILHHMASYGGDTDFKPNFTRAIMHSAAFFPEGDLSETEGTYQEFLTHLNAENLTVLQDKSTEELQAANELMTYNSNYGYFRFGPTVDYDYVPKLPGQSLQKGEYHKGISVMIGHTYFDGLLFTPPWLRNDDAVAKYVKDLWPSVSGSTLALMRYYYHIDQLLRLERDKIIQVASFLDDIAVQCNSWYMAQAMLEFGDKAPVYKYAFNAKPAIHGSDLLFEVHRSLHIPFVVDALTLLSSFIQLNQRLPLKLMPS